MRATIVDATTHETTSWEPVVEFPDRDIMVIRNGYPFSSKLVDAARGVDECLWNTSTVVGYDGEKAEEDVKTNTDRRSSHSLSLTNRNQEEDVKAAPDCADALERLGEYAQQLRAVEGAYVMRYAQASPHLRAQKTSVYELLRYGPTEEFKEHIDAVYRHPTLSLRQLSVIAFANDDYDGGELVFPRQELELKPEAGTVIIFPSGFSFPHAVRPVMSGERYSIVAWIY